MEKYFTDKYGEFCPPEEAIAYLYDGPGVDVKIKEMEAENARLRQQRDAANAQIQFLMELLNGGVTNG